MTRPRTLDKLKQRIQNEFTVSQMRSGSGQRGISIADFKNAFI